MAASANNNQFRATGASQLASVIKNSAQVYKNCQGAVDTTGYAKAWTGAAGEIPYGRISAGELYGTGLGDTSAANPPQLTFGMDAELILDKAVTGASALTDHGMPVYWSNDNTLTLTRPTRGRPAGHVHRWKTGTTCDVLIYGALLDARRHMGVQLLNLGGFSAVAAHLGTGDGIQFAYPGRIRVLSFYGIVCKTLAGGTSIVITLKFGSTAMTGGVLSFGATDAAGTKLDSTEITALNVGSESDVLVGSIAVTGTYTAGAFNLFALVETLPGV